MTDKNEAQKTTLKKEGAGQPQALRRRAVNHLKRQIILDAARRVFESHGLVGANVRAIAAEAGYTASAIYNHYGSKEEIYGDLLAQSLEWLNAAVAEAADEGAPVALRIEQHALAFYDFYLEHPRELDLGFYLFQGMRPLGLTQDINDTLNRRLRDALSDVERGLSQLNGSEAFALKETTALFGHCVGLLLLTHTRRIRMFGQNGRELFQEYVKTLLKRCLAERHD